MLIFGLAYKNLCKIFAGLHQTIVYIIFFFFLSPRRRVKNCQKKSCQLLIRHDFTGVYFFNNNNTEIIQTWKGRFPGALSSKQAFLLESFLRLVTICTV